MKYLFLSIISFFLMPATSHALTIDSVCVKDDTICNEKVDIHYKQFIAPASLLIVGSIGLIDHSPIYQLSDVLHQQVERNSTRTISADEYLQYLPFASHLTLGLCGVKSKHNFRDRTIAAATSFIFISGATKATKMLISEQRPDRTDYSSFPSGHTARAFAGAELMRIEYGNYYGLAAYGVAGCVALMRIHNNRHYAHDVLAGAGIGILGAKVGYWMLPVWKRWLHLDRKNISAVCMPTYSPDQQNLALSGTIIF